MTPASTCMYWGVIVLVLRGILHDCMGKVAPLMSLFRVRSAKQQLPAAAILLVAILTGWFAYSPGITGSIQFDDLGSLGELAFVEDFSSALTYVLSGTAGPLGRPLARATFLLEAHAWPSAPEVFLRTNILLHLLNGALVAWFLYLLGILRQQSEQGSALIACGTGAIWMLLPILASSSLFIVQRMTTLSATFVLAGAIAYLYQRRAIERHPVLVLAGMTLSLGLGVVLGALTKENGALLLVYMLAVELTLLNRPRVITRSRWRLWFSVVLVLPGAILLAYLATRIP